MRNILITIFTLHYFYSQSKFFLNTNPLFGITLVYLSTAELMTSTTSPMLSNYLAYLQANLMSRNKYIFVAHHNCTTGLEYYLLKKKKKISLFYVNFYLSSELHNAFASIWSNWMQNSILLQYCDRNDSKNLDVFSYFPYRNQQCGGVFNVSNIQRIGYFSLGDDEQQQQQQIKYQVVLNDSMLQNHFRSYYHSYPFFPPKLPLNLHGCMLKIGYKVWPPFVISVKAEQRYSGYEFDFLLIVRDILNCTYRLKEFPRISDYLPIVLVRRRI